MTLTAKLLLIISLLLPGISEGAQSFEEFSIRFLEALAGNDRVAVLGMMPEPSVQAERFAFDDSFFSEFGSESRSLRSIYADGGFFAIEVVVDNDLQRANLFIVSRAGRPTSTMPPVIPYLSRLRIQLDYAVCPLEKIDGRVVFSQPFCFSETDF